MIKPTTSQQAVAGVDNYEGILSAARKGRELRLDPLT
jgi:hypothetical protein